MSAISPDSVRAELERIVASPKFRDAPGLVRLLQFVVGWELEGRGTEIKESTIAIEVFSRGQDFDGRLDNLVRVNASRLRAKLTAYYAEEGSEDEVHVEIPRGSYVPKFSIGGGPQAAHEEETHPDLGNSEEVETVARRGFGRLWVAAAAACVVLAVVAFLSYRAGVRNTAAGLPARTRELYARLWTRPVVMVYRVPVFLRIERHYPAFLLYEGHVTAMTYESLPLPSDVDDEVKHKLGDRTVRYENTWTDVGVAQGIHSLSTIFGRAGVDLTIEDTLNATAAQFRDKNVIVVSTPWFSSLVGQLPALRHFQIERNYPRITGPKTADGKVTDYRSVRLKDTGAMISTTGFVSLGPGFWPGTRLLRVSGLDPIGVQGAARFITSEAGLEELARRMGGKISAQFEAVLVVNCLKGQVSTVTVAEVWHE